MGKKVRNEIEQKIWLLFGIAVAVIMAISFGCAPKAEEVEPIKIGAPDALTGGYAADGLLMLNATIMAAEEINAEGATGETVGGSSL